jgi:KUP system potassium uptake protein
MRFGFMEKADVPAGLQTAIARGQIAPCELAQVTYFTGHESIIATSRKSNMVRWRKALFAWLHRNAEQPGAYFNIPSAQIMEVGLELEI